ncbi:hypothetical protein ASD19_03570 [Microbacterium sp. Root53]|nr:hypothetical protein ASD19_03570 [Microbacterium sp. Root53]
MSITTGTTTSRLALTQDITLPAGGGTSVVDFASKIDAISGGGKAGFRFDVLDGSKGTFFFGTNVPTNSWERTRGAFVVPADSTKIRVHVFNDQVKATALYDDVIVHASSAAMELMTSKTASGDIALSWLKPAACSSSRSSTRTSSGPTRRATGSP